jgi:hypothetical protein
MIVLVAILGMASAAAYLWRRQWIDAALVLVAAGALALIAADLGLPAAGGTTVAIDSAGTVPPIGDAAALALSGDGLRAAQWHDLPARPLQWKAPASAALRLEFPRQLELGRMFTLTVRRTQASRARLQLLAENNQVIAEASGAAADIAVQWLPPVAETLVLKARLLDAGGTPIAQGPIPVSVRAAVPLQVRGRFGAPSFDARILNDLLANSNALLDWQVTLGKTVTRNETARAAMNEPNLIVIDAAWFERLHQTARTALLAQVADGTPLIVLAANASDAGLWKRAVQLDLKPQPEHQSIGAPLAMAAAPFNPASTAAGAWSGSENGIWTRAWRNGRIAWLGVSDWHRYAISEPRALAGWWQGVLDQAGVRRVDDVVWQLPPGMPLPGERLEVCAQGVRGAVEFPDLKQTASWQRRPDKADAACVAVWPQKPGWLKMRAEGARPQAGELYVFAPDDWPLWQRAQRRDATAHYAARTPTTAAQGTTRLPDWPFGAVFALAMLGLWWRERR